MNQSPDPARPDDGRVERRSELLPEERDAGSDDPNAQAEAVLADSDERTDDSEETRHQPEDRSP